MGQIFKVMKQAKDAIIPQEQQEKLWYKITKGLFITALVCGFLYLFLVGLALMGDAFKALAGESAGTMFEFAENPIAGLMVGILATVLVQSSSTTSSIIVAAVASGALPVNTAIPMIFGANIGTSVTSTIVSLGFSGDRENYRRGFSGATVHDMFNFMNVALWLPVEWISSAINNGNGGLLFLLSEACVKNWEGCDKDKKDCEKWVGPLKTITSEFTSKIIKIDKDVIKDFSKGEPSAELCAELCERADVGANGDCPYKFSRKKCADTPLNLTKKGSCEAGSKKAKAEFLFCSKVNGTIEVNDTVLEQALKHYDAFRLVKDGYFYEQGWTDEATGTITLIFSIIFLTFALWALVKILSYAVRSSAEGVLKRALNMNGYLAILVGTGVTIFVQSSSITTSVLTPLVAVGTLSLEGMLPLTLGANIGTTFTGLMAALVGSSIQGMQIALVHVFFNIFGVIEFYPWHVTRQIPIKAASSLGDAAAVFRPFPVFYVVLCFFVYPLFFLGVSIGYEQGGAGPIVGSTIGLLVFLAINGWAIFWFYKRDGKRKTLVWIEKRGLGFKTDEKQLEEGEDVESAASDSDEGRVSTDEQEGSIVQEVEVKPTQVDVQ